MAAQRYEDIDVSVEGNIEVLTLRRPEVRNALRHQTFAELETLEHLFDTEDHREGVRAFLEKRQPTFAGA